MRLFLLWVVFNCYFFFNENVTFNLVWESRKTSRSLKLTYKEQSNLVLSTEWIKDGEDWPGLQWAIPRNVGYQAYKQALVGGAEEELYSNEAAGGALYKAFTM